MGHPDWQATTSAPVPLMVGSLPTTPPGSSFGPTVISVPNGGLYLIRVGAVNPAQSMLCDITVQHIDTFGNVVYEDVFGGVAAGDILPGSVALLSPSLLRGNIYGSQLSITGTVSSAANLNAIYSSSSISAAHMFADVYTLPLFLADPEPKVSNGASTFGSFVGPTPGGLLAAYNTPVLAPGATTGVVPIVPYSGPAIFTLEQAGVTTTPIDCLLSITGFTVANGANLVYTQVFRTQFANVGFAAPLNLPACFNIFTITNLDGAQNLTARFTLIAGNSA